VTALSNIKDEAHGLGYDTLFFVPHCAYWTEAQHVRRVLGKVNWKPMSTTQESLGGSDGRGSLLPFLVGPSLTWVKAAALSYRQLESPAATGCHSASVSFIGEFAGESSW
jgi:hypothetical protein